MQQIIIISGKQGEGKTQMCEKLAQEMQRKGDVIGGFIAPGTWENGERHSFQIVDLQTLERFDFASREKQKDWEYIRPFYFNPLSIKKGEEILRTHSKTSDWLIIDEIGRFEIKDKIWGPVLKELIKEEIDLVISVRDIFVEDVVEHFGIRNHLLLKVNESNHFG